MSPTAASRKLPAGFWTTWAWTGTRACSQAARRRTCAASQIAHGSSHRLASAMSEKPPPEEKQKIVVGSPLPFSVFGAEGQLLLAEGAVVETDHTRRMLLLKGVYH